MIEQHSLKMVALPDEVNLKSPALADLYRTATVQVTGKKPGEMITQSGEPIIYSVTIPQNAAQPPGRRGLRGPAALARGPGDHGRQRPRPAATWRWSTTPRLCRSR